QSRGKNERFHRTLKAEVFAFKRYRDLADVQRAFDQWRAIYNLDRPHEHWTTTFRQAATGPVCGQCRTACQVWTTTSTRSSALSPPPRLMSASKVDCGRYRRPFV